MKTILTFVLILGTSLFTIAQNSDIITEFQKQDFNSNRNRDTTEYFKISPEFNTDSTSFAFKLKPELPEENDNKNDHETNPAFVSHQLPEFRMPVAGGGSGPIYFNMPIAVPDSTVRYYIKEKRIQYVNPLEGKFK